MIKLSSLYLKPIWCWLLLVFVVLGCKEKTIPRPHGYYRIAFLPKTYKPLLVAKQFKCSVPQYATFSSVKGHNSSWYNLDIKPYNAQLHLSYYGINGNFDNLTEDSYKLAYKHAIKADGINERRFINPARKVYGIVYSITGNAASPIQFFVTDSVKNFLRGALYINDTPNVDSLSPVVSYLIPDVVHLIESLEWAN